jgi:Uma2 family endonuclease
MYDLKSEDPEEPGLPDEYHGYQPLLLRHTFKPTNCDLDEVFIGADINLYYDLRHLNWYKRPDWFAVVGVSRLYEGRDLRNSYVMWQELVSPFVVVELLSPGTEDEDLGRTVRQLGKPPTKWQVYEQILRVPYYFVFSRYTNELQAFRLVGGAYESLEVGEEGLLVPHLGLRLGLWQGRYENIERLWLRWFTASGELILTPSEEAATAQARVAQAEQRAERLAAKLRELNIDPDELE